MNPNKLPGSRTNLLGPTLYVKSQKKKAGRPTVPWQEYASELLRRFRTGEACETAWKEAHYLSEWAKHHSPPPDGGTKSTVYAPRTIYYRLLKRLNGPPGYTAWYREVQNKAKSRLSVNDRVPSLV